MAKKLRVVRKSPIKLFSQLLIPWLVMGLLAIAGTAAGLESYAILALSLTGALLTTYLIFRIDRAATSRLREP